MANKKISQLDAVVSLNGSDKVEVLQSSDNKFFTLDQLIEFLDIGGAGVKTGTASGTDTYAVSIPDVLTYTLHDVYEIIFTNGNTGSSTININTLGAKTLKKSVSTNLASGDITAGQSFFIVYDGTNFQVIGSGSGGTVTSVAALTLGTTGTDLSSTVANGTTTPVITLQVPTASASNRGALSSTDWSTFNGKQAALGFTPENVANKDTDSTFAANSDTKYPSQKAVKTANDLKANIASPTFTGTPAAPTAAVSTNTTQLATTAFVQAALTSSQNIGSTLFLYYNFY